MNEGMPTNRIERHILKQGGGLQAEMEFEPTIYMAENEERSREVAGLQNLLPFERRMRYDQQGDIFVRSSPPKRTQPDMFPYIVRKKSPRVAYVRWSKLGTIETAIRQASHIAEQYGKSGETTKSTLTVVDTLKGLTQAYQQSNVDEEARLQLEVETAAILEQTGYANATKPEKQGIATQIVSAAKRDSKERINRSRSRLILSHVWIDVSRELIVGRKAGEKYSTLRELLLRERALERFCLEQTEERIENILSIRQGSPELEGLMRDLKLFVYTYNSGEYVKVKPYSRAAAITRFALFGDGQKQDDVTGISSDVRKLAQFLGMEEALRYSGAEHFTKLSPEAQRRRLRLVQNEIAEALEKGERDLYKEGELSEGHVATV